MTLTEAKAIIRGRLGARQDTTMVDGWIDTELVAVIEEIETSHLMDYAYWLRTNGPVPIAAGGHIGSITTALPEFVKEVPGGFTTVMDGSLTEDLGFIERRSLTELVKAGGVQFPAEGTVSHYAIIDDLLRVYPASEESIQVVLDYFQTGSSSSWLEHASALIIAKILVKLNTMYVRDVATAEIFILADKEAELRYIENGIAHEDANIRSDKNRRLHK